MKEKGEAYKQPAHYEEIHMPKNSGAGIVIAAFALHGIWFRHDLAYLVDGDRQLHRHRSDLDY